MKGFHKVFLICVVIIQGCGGSKTDNNCNDCDPVVPSTQPEESTFILEGRVAPPLSGSTVFIDLNGDNLQGENEPVATTDKAGFFNITVPTGTTGKIVTRGGEDISTGVEMPELTLLAEIPSDTSELTLITPLSTLTFGLGANEKQALFGTFDIENDIAIVSGKDHWDLAQKNDISAKAIQRINQTVSILMQSAISVSQGLDPSSAKEASVALARLIPELATSNSLNHSNPESVSLILQETSSVLAPNAPLSMEYADEIAVPISLLNSNLDNYNINPTSDTLTPVLGVSQRELQPLIVRLVRGEISIEDFRKATDPVNLFSSIDLPPGFDNGDGSINEAPVIGDQSFDVLENQTIVHTVVASDPDEDTLTYALEGTNANDFLITSRSGALSFKNAPNFEHKHSYSVDVKVTDNGSPSRANTATITVNVTDVNEAPEIANQTFELSENLTAVGNVVASDADAGDAPIYSLMKDTDANVFTIDSSSGVLSFKNPPNFEDKNSYSIDVRVTDEDDPLLSNTAKITVNVTDENEAPVIFNQTFDVPEEQTTINTVFASDPDTGNILTYALQGTDASLFNIDPNSGALSFITAPDFENSNQKKTYSVNVRVTDNHDQPISSSATVTVNVTDVNEAPRISNQTFNTSENQTDVGTVVASDPDDENTLTYTLVEGSDASLFNIVDSNGVLSFKTAPDFEDQKIYSFDVKVTDNGSPSKSTTATITVNLSDANDAPEIVNKVFYAPENQTDVGTVVASDPDADETLTYLITGGPDASLFNIIDSNGFLSFKNPPNFEGINNYSINVQVTDSGSPSLSNTATITINVTDVNEAPVIDEHKLYARENQKDIGTVVASDPDRGDTLEYSLSGEDANHLSIDESGHLSFLNTPDFETQRTYKANIKVTDNGSPSLSATAELSVSVTNVNEAPIIEAQTFDVLENQTTVGTVIAEEPESQALRYTMTGGPDLTYFEIGYYSGLLSFRAPQDFENSNKNSYTIKVKVAEGIYRGALYAEEYITINLVDVNEPPAISNQTFYVSQNETAAGTVLARDFDADDILTFTIEGGSDASLFNIDPNSGALNFKTAPNSDAKETYTVNIKVTDGGESPLSNTATITVNISDFNEAPSISNQTFTVLENQTAVGKVDAQDTNAGDVLTYAVEGTDANAFNIDSRSGDLSFKTAPNFDDKATYNVNVKVTDNGSPPKSATASITVYITNQNEAPVIANQTFDVPENQTYVGNVDAQDSNARDTLTFDLEGTEADAFNIDSRSGDLSFKTAPNFDDKASYSVVVKVTDDGSPSLFNRATITVNVTNINKAPVIADHTIFSNENQSFLGTINASDPDAEDKLTYALAGMDASLFNIDPNSGDLSFIVAPNFENSDQKNTYNVNVIVTDNGSPSKSNTAAITIKVSNVNEIPIISDQIFNVPENQTTVGTVDAEDPDANDTLTYTLMEGSDANLFNIEDGSGDLSFIAAPDFENPNQKNTYNVNVRVSDTGNPSLANTAKITVNITNVNEPPVINDQAFNVSENQTAVGTVAAEDPDANDILTYTLVEGSDANLFNIEGGSGDLSFIAAPDFENQNQKNTYSVKVRVTDKGSPSKSTKATITVNVSDANDAPVIVSEVFYAPENQTAVGIVDAEDPDTNDTLTYTLVEGSDANLFNIEDDSGVLSFIAAPDFENPNQKNTYSVNLKVMDSGSPSKSTTEKITINVTDVNEAPVIDDQSFNITENKTDIGPVIAMDHDVGDTLEYSLSGSDASLFNIDAIGNLSFISAPDFENSNKKNTYSINVKVTDDDNQPISNMAAITVNVTDILEVDIDFQKTSSGHDGESFYQLYKNTSFVMEAEASGQEAIDISQAVFSIEDSEENIIKPSINFTEIRNSPGDAPLNKYFVELNAVELKAQTTYSLKMDLKVKDKSSSVSKKIKVEVDDGNSTRINGIAKVTNGETEINLDGLSNESELHVFDSACLNKLEHIFSDASNCNHQTIKPNGSTFSLTDSVDMKQLILKTGNYLSEVGLPFPIFNNHYLVLFKEKLWMFSNNQIWYSSDGFTWLQVSQQMDFAPNKRFGYRVVVFDDALWVLGGFSGSGHDLVRHKDVWKSEDGITWNEETNEANFISTTNPEILTYKHGDEEEKIWMIGGSYIWNSNDGVTWEQITAPENIDISHDRTQALVDKDGNLQLVGPVLDQGRSKDPLTAGYEYAGNNQWYARTPSVGPKKQDRLIIPYGGHEAINFKGDTWVVGGSCYMAYHEEYGEYYYDFEDCNYLHKLNGSFTSGYWQHVNVEGKSKKVISRRVNSNMVVFDEKLWISDSNHSNHWGGVSYSADGIAWLETNDLMVRPPNRTDHQVVYFKNKMWSIGGSTIGMIYRMHPLASLKNDIWISEDGINWAQAQNEMPFTARRGHQAVVFENHLWLIGGYEGECKTNEYPCSDYQTNDIWKSSDGINWQQIKDNADFTIREGHQVKLFNEELWLIGGYGQGQYNNEIWKSNNGEDWEQVQITDGNSSFSARSGHQLVVFGSHLWLIGGFDGSTYKNDIWRSHNGKDWQEVTPPASIFSPRSEHQVSVFEGKLWLTGGKNTDGVADDIWFSIDGTNWEQYQSSHKPSSKEGHQMLTFDDGTQEQLRLIGGAAGIDHSDGGALDEIWSYQLSDEQWTRYMHITTPYPTGLQ